MYLVNDIIAFLAANLILSQALGTSSLFIAAQSRKNLTGIAFCIMLFTTFGTGCAYIVDSVLPFGASEFRLLLYTAAVSVFYILLLVLLYFARPGDYAQLRKYVHLSAFNCAVMGTLFTMSGKAEEDSSLMSFGEYVRFGFEAGLGFIAAALILTAAYRRLNSSKVPQSFRGGPAMLIYIGIISMAVWSLK
ncbi:MAG: hypothetical protein IKO47_09705 [Ruminococcus sp.]|nr:hypothetical protein [Ruminococcus sp.]